MTPVMGDSLRRRHGAGGRPRGGAGWRQPSSSGRRGRWVSAAVLACIVAFTGGWAVAVYIVFPPPPPPGDTMMVPSLVGRSLPEAERLLAEAGLVLEETRAIPHRSRDEGVVLAQSPLAGQQLLPGAGVRLAVSAGRARAPIPDLAGLPGTGAVAILARAGFDVEVEAEASDLPAGQVLWSEPPPGGEHELPALVTLYLSTGQPLDAEDDSLFAEEAVRPDDDDTEQEAPDSEEHGPPATDALPSEEPRSSAADLPGAARPDLAGDAAASSSSGSRPPWPAPSAEGRRGSPGGAAHHG